MRVIAITDSKISRVELPVRALMDLQVGRHVYSVGAQRQKLRLRFGLQLGLPIL